MKPISGLVNIVFKFYAYQPTNQLFLVESVPATLACAPAVPRTEAAALVPDVDVVDGPLQTSPRCVDLLVGSEQLIATLA